MPGIARAPIAAALLVCSIACAKEEKQEKDETPPAQAAPAAVKVAAASDLTFAFPEVAKAFEAKTGRKVIFTFGATGNLAKQITEGAPYDVFAAANVTFVDDVVKVGACDGASKVLYAVGRIVVWTPKGDVEKPAQLTDLTNGRFAKIAIANPEHAPYGRAAKQALESAGIWEEVKPRIVYGENVKQALQYAESGNAEAAIAPLSLAIVTDTGEALPIDPKLHQPINQAIAVCNNGSNREGGAEFVAFVASEEGRAIKKRFGFLMPGESAP